MVALVFALAFLAIALFALFSLENGGAMDAWVRKGSDTSAIQALDQVQDAFGLVWESKPERSGFEALGLVGESAVRVVVGDAEVRVEWSGGFRVEGAEAAWVEAPMRPPEWRATTSGAPVQTGDVGFDRRFVVRGGDAQDDVLKALSAPAREALLALEPARASITEEELVVVWSQDVWAQDPCGFMERTQVAAQALRRAQAEEVAQQVPQAVVQAVGVS